MGQLVDQRHLGCPGQHRVQVKLAEGRPAILDLLQWNHLQVFHLRRSVGAPVGLAESDDHVGSTSEPAVGFAEHGYGLADPWCGAEVDPQ